MKKYSLLLGVALVLLTSNVAAQETTGDGSVTCIPPCSELGYDMDEEQCHGRNFVRCPFDQSKVFCTGSCMDEGYTTGVEARCSNSEHIIDCPYDQNYAKLASDWQNKCKASYTSGSCKVGAVFCTDTPESGSCSSGTLTYCDTYKYCYICVIGASGQYPAI